MHGNVGDGGTFGENSGQAGFFSTVNNKEPTVGNEKISDDILSHGSFGHKKPLKSLTSSSSGSFSASQAHSGGFSHSGGSSVKGSYFGNGGTKSSIGGVAAHDGSANFAGSGHKSIGLATLENGGSPTKAEGGYIGSIQSNKGDGSFGTVSLFHSKTPAGLASLGSSASIGLHNHKLGQTTESHSGSFATAGSFASHGNSGTGISGTIGGSGHEGR